MAKKWINDVLDIRETKSGKLIIKFTQDKGKLEDFFTFLKDGADNKEYPGASLFLTKKKDDLKRQFDKGFLDESKYESLLDSTSFIKYIGSCSIEE